MQTLLAAQLPPPSPSSTNNRHRKSYRLPPPARAPCRPQTRRHLQCPHATHPPAAAHPAMRVSPADRAASASSSTGARNPIGSTPSDPTCPVAYPPPTTASSTSSWVPKRSRQSVSPSSSPGVHPVKKSLSLAHMNRPRGRIRLSSSMSKCSLLSTLFLLLFSFGDPVRRRAHCFRFPSNCEKLHCGERMCAMVTPMSPSSSWGSDVPPFPVVPIYEPSTGHIEKS